MKSLPTLVAAALIGLFVGVVGGPMTEVQALKYMPDSWEYLYGAVAILHGKYVVDFSGVPDLNTYYLPVGPTVPQYPPGLSLLLAPAVLLGGGFQAGLWVPLIAAVLLGVGAALLAGRIAGQRAAPFAVALVILTPAVVLQSRVVMSDLPSAALGIVVVVVLASMRGRDSILAAGLIAGALVWMRYGNIAIVVAGLVAVTAVDANWRRNVIWYVAGAAPPMLLLALWQFQTFGSPLVTTYQAIPASISHASEIGSYFSPRFLLGQPWSRDSWELGGLTYRLGLPNGLLYPLQLLGGDPYLLMPGVGVLGLIGLSRHARRLGAAGVIGRFGLASIVATLAIYAPYYHQSGRFLEVPAALLAVGAASLAAAPLFAVAGRAYTSLLVAAANRRSNRAESSAVRSGGTG